MIGSKTRPHCANRSPYARRVNPQGNCGRNCCFFQYLPEVLPLSPWKPVPLAPDPSCVFATEVSGREEFMCFRNLRRHADLGCFDASIARWIELRPVSYRAPFGEARNSFPYRDLSISGGIHQSKMPSPCRRGKTRRITLNRAVICRVSAFKRTRTADAKSCRKTQIPFPIYKTVSRSNRNCPFRATQVLRSDTSC